MERALRCINNVNFVRKNEPRFPMDMMEPIREQMAILQALSLPATWPIQYDALDAGPICPFLKEQMPPNHEPALWLEMNEPLCRHAGVEWRGRPGFEWDHLPSVAYTLGYSPEERVRLADTAMEGFRTVWGRYPETVSCWNLDAITVSHLVDHYGVAGFAVCRDQISTDGYTLWGAPFAGYYPSRVNLWSPATAPVHQIGAPVLRMLGQDPVYCYDSSFPRPDGTVCTEPDTLEPAWSCADDEGYVEAMLRMFELAPSQQFAYVQLGQENTFPWHTQSAAYPKQMQAAAAIRDRRQAHVETLSQTAKRFREAFSETPTQAQVQLVDPLGHKDQPQRTVWYASKHYRANMHLSEGTVWIRDLTIYRDAYRQPFLDSATRSNEVEQRMLSAMDAYHWRPLGHSPADLSCGGYLFYDGVAFELAGIDQFEETPASLSFSLHENSGATVRVSFEPERLHFRSNQSSVGLAIDFRWDAVRTACTGIEGPKIQYRFAGFDYSIEVEVGTVHQTPTGLKIDSVAGQIVLRLSA